MSAPNGNGYISRGNMTVIISAAGLVMLAFGGFLTFQNTAIDNRINDLKAEVRGFEGIYLRKDEHGEFKLRVDKDVQHLSEDALRRQASVVPRTEHEARWIATENSLKGAIAREAEDFKLFSDRLNEVRGALTGSVTLRDEIKRLQDDIAEMRHHQMRDKQP